MIEIRPVPSAPEYGVTRQGDVYRILPWRRMPRHIVLPYRMKQRPDKDGYRMAGWILKVHRAVAEAYVPNPDNLPEVCHKDGVRSNNDWLNLRWGTHASNLLDMDAHGTRPKGTEHVQAKLDEKMVVEARRRARSGESHSSIAEDMPVERSVLSRAIRGDTWRHV